MRARGRFLARAALIFSIVGFASVVSDPPPASAQPGDADAGFGDCGMQLGGFSSMQRVVTLARPDGRLVLAGHDANGVRLVGLTASGSPDLSFGFGGVVAITELDGTISDAYLDDGGRIVVGGTNGSNGFVVRFTSTGALDSSFGFGGAVVVDRGANETVYDIAPTSAGGVLVAGSRGSAPLLARLQGNGATDASLTLDASLTTGLLVAVKETSDGSIWIARQSPDASVARLTSTGALDGATLSIDFPTPSGSSQRVQGVFEIAERAGGGILLAGDVRYRKSDGDFGADLVVAGYTAGLAVDASFGSAGRTVLDFGRWETVPDLAVTDDALTVTGIRYDSNGGTSAVLARLDSSGTPDASFDTDGRMQVGFGTDITVPSVAVRNGRAFVGAAAPALGPLVRAIALRAPAEGAGFVLDGFGELYPFAPGGGIAPPCVVDGPVWDGWSIARGLATVAGGGWVADGWGGLHPFSLGEQDGPGAASGPYWKHWDIVRGIAALPSGTGGYVVDGWGGLHGFARSGQPKPGRATDGPYWRGWDIARGVAILPDGSGGYVLDGWGALHPFALPGGEEPPAVRRGPYWRGWDIARGVTLLPDGTGGYVVDGWGGLHPFAVGDAPVPARASGGPYFAGTDVVRGVSVLPNP